MKKRNFLVDALVSLCVGVSCFALSSCRVVLSTESNDSSVPTVINGVDGKDGVDGVGIDSVAVNSAGVLTVTLTDGSEIVCGVVKGKDGTDGVSLSAAKIDDSGRLLLTLTDGSIINCGVVTGNDGKDGENGVDGKDGENGKDGSDGVGVYSTALDENGNLVVTYTDGTTDVIEHHWQLIYTLEEATHEKDGIYVYTCSDCGLARVVYGKYYTKGLAYVLNEDNASYSVTGIGEATDTEIVVPETYNNLPVTAIAEKAFFQNNDITSITLPDSVTKIGANAFAFCELTELTLPDSLTDVGEYAFYSCTALKTVVAGSAITTVEDTAFAGSGVEKVLFKGTAEEWANVSAAFPNGAVCYYYSEEEPSEGNYWRYVNGVPTVWEVSAGDDTTAEDAD